MHENDLFAYVGPAAVNVIVLPATVMEAVPVALWPVSLVDPVLLVEKPNSEAVTPVHDSGGANDATPKLNKDSGPIAMFPLIVALTVSEPFESYCAVALTKSCDGPPSLSPAGSRAVPLPMSATASPGTTKLSASTPPTSAAVRQ